MADAPSKLSTGAVVRHVSLNDGSMAAADHGNRWPLMLIHGFPLDGRIWQPQVDALSDERRVLAPDLLGFGQSSAASRTALDAHADDLAALLDALGIERAIIGGVSMGGYVALAMWRRHRDRFAGMILASTKAGADSESARAGRYQTATNVAEQGTGAVVDGMLPKMTAPEADPELVARLRSIMADQPAAGVIDALKAMAARVDSTPDLAHIDVPTLVIAGAQDTLIPPSESEAIAALVPGAELVILPRAGHIAGFEAPGAFNGAVRSFLNRVDTR